MVERLNAHAVELAAFIAAVEPQISTAVESAPVAPESFLGSADTSSTLLLARRRVTGSGCARRDIFDAGCQKLVPI